MHCTVYVRQEDLLKAKEIDDKVFAQEVPDGEGMSRPEELDLWTCPGCGNRLGEKDLKCNSCGLALYPPRRLEVPQLRWSGGSGC